MYKIILIKPMYYGKEIDVGLYEAPIGKKVQNPRKTPVDPEPQRVNLALNKSITANYTHPKIGLEADKLVDGLASTRWACCDPDQMTTGYPILLTVDFGKATDFNEVYLDEYSDSQTNLRIEKYELQRWDKSTQNWVTFDSSDTGMGHDKTHKTFGNITSTKLRVKITKQFDSETWTPSMSEIQVYNNAPVSIPTLSTSPH